MHRDGQNGRIQGENRRVFSGLGGAAQIDAEDVERIAWPAPDSPQRVMSEARLAK